MRRGLKCIVCPMRHTNLTVCHRRFPDEEGTEIFFGGRNHSRQSTCHRRFPDEEGTEIPVRRGSPRQVSPESQKIPR